MDDIEIPAPLGAASVRQIGRVLGAAGIALEGGGMWSRTAHYLVEDGAAAQRVLEGAGLSGIRVRSAVVVPLDADVPGALGAMMATLADAGVELIAQYSDHDNRKVLVVTDPAHAQGALHQPAGGS